MTPDTIRCPTCRAINWHHDGFAMIEARAGEVVRQRIRPSAVTSSPWSCQGCRTQVPEVSSLAARLTETRLFDEE